MCWQYHGKRHTMIYAIEFQRRINRLFCIVIIVLYKKYGCCQPCRIDIGELTIPDLIPVLIATCQPRVSPMKYNEM